MKKPPVCRYENCAQLFNYRQKRSKHERKYKQQSRTMIPKQFSCSCSNKSRGFLTARDRWNHKHYKAKNGEFLCDRCTKQLSSMQKMNQHVKKCKKMVDNNLFKKTEKN